MIAAFALAALLQQSPMPSVAPDGVFRSRGYGLVIVRAGQDLRVYHEAAGACWPDPDGEDLKDSFAAVVPVAEGIGLTEAHDDQASIYVFDRLPALPPACEHPDTSDRAAVLAVSDLMQAYYPGFEARKIDFQARRSDVLARLSQTPAPSQAFAAAADLLSGLDDAHIELSAEIEGRTQDLQMSSGRTLDAVNARAEPRAERAWLGAWREGVLQAILDGEGHAVANNRVFWGVNDGVGYLAIVTMGGFDAEDAASTELLEAALDEAMMAFDGARAVIVDVSNNRGGYDSVSRLIASRFADQPRVAYTKRGWGSGVAPQVVEVRPSDRPGYHGPVWLLTSDITVSAGETFSQMMTVLPSVTHAGTRTRGAFSDQSPVVLANGWRFAMPMELYVDPQGHPLEGRGLMPQVRIDLYPEGDLDHGHAKAVKALMRRLSH